MGGIGSGKSGGAAFTDLMRRLDVRPLARDGALARGTTTELYWTHQGRDTATLELIAQTESVAVKSRWLQGGEWRQEQYLIYLDRTVCNFGGSRVWWRCPAANCGRRSAILYGGGFFACRHCRRLAYRSQRETDQERAWRRANELRRRLGWPTGVAHADGQKPSNLHRRTYNRLRMRYYEAVMEALGDWRMQADKIARQLTNISEGLRGARR